MCFAAPSGESDVKERFLRPYWQHYINARKECGSMVENGAADEFERFLLDFKIALIDFTR